MMDINKADIEMQITEDDRRLVSLKWYRGASRYTNGATLFGDKYILRLIIARAKELAVKKHNYKQL